MLVYVVIILSGYVPNAKVFKDHRHALYYAREYASGWDNERYDTHYLYFNQESEGDMSESVTVQCLEVIS